MEIIIGGFVALFALAGIIYLVRVNRNNKDDNKDNKEITSLVSNCCGAHEVCEADQLKTGEAIIEYFDDEELDAFKNKTDADYTDNEIEQFREVLYTLKTNEIRNWLLSIESREIKLPSILVSESRMLMAEG